MARLALASILSIALLPTGVFSDACDLADEANFPSTVCSVTSLGNSFTELRFGRVDQLNPAANAGETILRSGISVFLIDGSTQVLQRVSTDDDDDDDDVICGSVDINSKLGEEIAYVLDGDSLNAPRRISRIWILGCEVSQPR